MVRHGLPIVVAGLLLSFASCGSEPAPVAEQASPPSADERRLVREYNALLRGVAIDVRIPGAECTTLPRRTRAELRDSPQRIGAQESTLRQRAVLDPAATVSHDVERLRYAGAISPRVTVSGHVYDVLTGLVGTVIPADR